MKTQIGALRTMVVTASLGVACVPQPSGVVEIVSDNAIEFTATVAARAFGAQDEMNGYHFIVWEGGGSADHALLRTDVSDLQVLQALEGIGATPGNALGIDTWDQRYDVNAAAPEQVIRGPRVRIEIWLPGSGVPLQIGDILEDPGKRGFDMRFGGHRANISKWHSGCVVCLYSCPGSKVGNAAYTVRDFVDGGSHFSVRPGVLPTDGTQVRVRLVLEQEQPS